MTEFVQVRSEALLTSWSWSLHRATVEHPGGSFTREVIRHPGAVTVVAVHADDRVTLVRQYRASTDSWVVEACAGTRDVPGEPAQACAARELLEEAGLVASRWTELGTILVSPGVSDEQNVLFLAEDLVEGDVAPHGPEEDAMQSVVWSFDEVSDAIDRGVVVDAKTLVALTRSSQVLRARGRVVPEW